MDQITVMTWLRETTVANVPLLNICIAIAAALLAYLAMTLALSFVVKRLAALSERTHTSADNMLVEVLSGTRRSLIALVALLIGIGLLDLPGRWSGRVNQLWFVVLVLQLALWANRIISIGLRRYSQRQAPADTQALSAAATLMSWGLRTLVWTVVLLAMLSNMGVNITAFIASLGVGGIAVALAAQSVLGDLFASVSIALDKPFEVGDFIVSGNVVGSIENVGVKTTRIRSLGGEQIVIANTELLKLTVSNYKRMRERRIVFSFGITLDASAAQAQAVADAVKRVIQQSERVRFDRAHFKAFGSHSLDYEAVYIVLSPEYNVYMDEQQRINLALIREFETLGVSLAIPARRVHLVEPAETADERTDDSAAATGNTTAAAPATS